MLKNKHSKFTLSPKTTYLNCAYMSPLLKEVEKSGIRGLRSKRNPVNVLPAHFFNDSESLRIEFSKTINATDPSRIVIIPSVSYGMATVAKNIRLKKGENIIIAAEQFPSNYYAWQRVCEESGGEIRIITPPDTFRGRGEQWNEKILQAITSQTKIVAIGHVHWADGTKFDLEAIRARSLEVGAFLIIDGTQSVGALPFDVQKIKPDALIVAGYKWLMGPYSIGLAYYGDYFDNGVPLEENWINRKNSEDFSGLVNYQDQYQHGSLRYEVGEHSNFILVPMMLKALIQINRWGAGNIQEYCKEITRDAINTLREHQFWIEEEKYRGHHLFGLRIPKEKDVDLLKKNLSKKNIYVSFRGDAIRVSPNVYNTARDLQRLVSALLSK
jgi:selenocysteine lyase/cysteine desulfurase